MGVTPWSVCRYRDGRFTAVDDVVVDEVPLTLFVNGEEVLTLLNLGENAVELAVGFLRSEGFFSAREELLGWDEAPGVVRLRVAREVGAVRRLMEKRTVTTGCGKGTTFYHAIDALKCRPVVADVTFSARSILDRMGELQLRSDLYRETGGTHNASLCSPTETLLFRTDIGRHNAVDMIGGRAFLDGLDVSSCALLTTGRVSSEILIKASKIGVPVVASRSAPTALALRIAEQVAVTVVGYIRGGRFNVYTEPRRIEGAERARDGNGQEETGTIS